MQKKHTSTMSTSSFHPALRDKFRSISGISPLHAFLHETVGDNFKLLFGFGFTAFLLPILEEKNSNLSTYITEQPHH